MKIIAIIGSPKGKGSGYKIVKMIEDRMTAMGNVEFEYIFLKEANLKLRIGCYNCMAKGEDKCPLKDDRAAIEQKLLAADDGIVKKFGVATRQRHTDDTDWTDLHGFRYP